MHSWRCFWKKVCILGSFLGWLISTTTQQQQHQISMIWIFWQFGYVSFLVVSIRIESQLLYLNQISNSYLNIENMSKPSDSPHFQSIFSGFEASSIPNIFFTLIAIKTTTLDQYDMDIMAICLRFNSW